MLGPFSGKNGVFKIFVAGKYQILDTKKARVNGLLMQYFMQYKIRTNS